MIVAFRLHTQKTYIPIVARYTQEQNLCAVAHHGGGRGHEFVVSMTHRVPTRADQEIKSCFEMFSVSNISLYMVGVILIQFSDTITRDKIPGKKVEHKLRSQEIICPSLLEYFDRRFITGS